MSFWERRRIGANVHSGGELGSEFDSVTEYSSKLA